MVYRTCFDLAESLSRRNGQTMTRKRTKHPTYSPQFWIKTRREQVLAVPQQANTHKDQVAVSDRKCSSLNFSNFSISFFLKREKKLNARNRLDTDRHVVRDGLGRD